MKTTYSMNALSTINSCTIFLCISFFTHSLLSNTNNQQTDQYEQIMFDWTKTWAEVMHLVKEKHYKVSDPKKAMSRAIDAFLNTLDPHSNFLDPETYKGIIESTTGEFHGVGIMINNMRKTKDKFLTIVETIQDGPAEKAGLKQYDKIVEINGKPLEGMTTEQATTLLKGPKNSNVNLKIMREGTNELLSFTVVRDIVKEQQSLCFYIKSKDIYYLSLSMFAENSAIQLEQLLKKTNEKKCKGLILDLRNNSGGLLSSVIDIAGLFLEKESIVVETRTVDAEKTELYRTSRTPIESRKIPLVILINNYTASAAEILAGCLKVHAEKNSAKNSLLVFIVGTTTFGKGSVQEVIPVSQNSAIKLTTRLYFLPYNTLVQGIGIKPDITVERYTPPSEQMLWLSETYGHENTLENFIKIDDPKIKKETKQATPQKSSKPWDIKVQQMLTHDNQLKEAINIASLIANAQEHFPDLITNRTTSLAYLRANYITQDTIDIVQVTL
ncbi:S41 family peptidase [Candidatus Dependentiae bacterium]|nr:MAG: S41 family peptidase [Candidatus Dependentiae bacterium]